MTITGAPTGGEAEKTTREPARRVPQERFVEAVPAVGVPARIAAVARQQVKELGLATVRRLPRLGRVAERARTQPLRSGSIRMYRWWKSPYGSDAKPQSVGDIPWDYVQANQDRIPFLGLREYWYPAIESRNVVHNRPTPVTMLGDNLVFFRDAAGRARALENRCPHRSALLSLGQVGVFEPGTITCRYHGMTFDGDGECIAFLADGPTSTACGKVRARAYPVEERAGVVFVYMGDDEPKPFFDSVPHASTVLAQERLFIYPEFLPFSHLNILDNAVDLTHPGCLHRTCLLFASQKPFGEVAYDELDGGLHIYFKDGAPHPGQMRIDHIEWHLPNLVYHAPGDLGGGLAEGWFWFVPRDVGSFTGWFVVGKDDRGGPIRQAVMSRLAELLFGRILGRVRFVPGNAISCIEGGDGPMLASQGRVAQWDRDHLARPDRAVVKARRMLQDAHRAEAAARAQRGQPERPITRPHHALAPHPD